MSAVHRSNRHGGQCGGATSGLPDAITSRILCQHRLAFETRPEQMTTDLFNDQAMQYAFSLDSRFAAEIFVGTHPKLVPCSLTHDRTTWWSVNPPTRFRESILSHHVPNGEKTYDQYMDEMESDGHALTDYHLLPGILWKYHVLLRCLRQTLGFGGIFLTGKTGNWQ
jgi:hypothetical protein